MVKGYLASQGINVSEERVADSLQRMDPISYDQRRHNTVDRVNPVRYCARYFGHKVHLDQNEKLSMFGVTHAIARDGYSGKIVAHLTLPVKNGLAIYEAVYRYASALIFHKFYINIIHIFLCRKAILEYGLWDQVRVDHGTEFYLTLFVQNHLRTNCHYGATDILPYVQSPSTQVCIAYVDVYPDHC